MTTIESLETRTMMSVVPSGTELIVTGALAANTINIFQKDASTLRIEDNGEVREFVSANFNSIRVTGGSGADTLKVTNPSHFAMTKRVTLNGLEGDDVLTGGDGADTLNGGGGKDVLSGGGSSDNLNGGSGDNQMFGGEGNDVMTAGTGQDVFDGGNGTDRADYSDRTAGLAIVLDDAPNDGQFVGIFVNNLQVAVRPEADNVKQNVENVTTGSGNDSIIAGTVAVNNVFSSGAGADRLRGRGGSDTLDGGAGDDVLIGAGQADSLVGGAGNDTLAGGAGDDILRGGDNNDILVGGIGVDRMFGDAGDDSIFSADGIVESVIDGGAGNDFLDSDAGDVFSNVEVTD